MTMTKSTVVVTEKNACINKMKDIISDSSKFEQKILKEDKQLSFHLKSEKKVID